MYANEVVQNKKKPVFLWVFSTFEMCERFSYHGVKGFLILFLTSQLGLDDLQSFYVYSLYAMIAYSGGLLFGIIGDKYLGSHYMLVSGTLMIIFGHLLVGVSFWVSKLFYYGLVSLALGTACFKGNIIPEIGNSYKDNPSLSIEKGFTIYYMFINVGVVGSYIFCGVVANFFGVEFAFLLAGIVILLGFVLFIMFSPVLYKKLEQIRWKLFLNTKMIFFWSSVILFIFLVGYLIKNMPVTLLRYISIFYIFAIVSFIYTIKSFYIVYLLSAALVYYALAMQTGSFLTMFFLRNVDKTFLGMDLPITFCQVMLPLATLAWGVLISIYTKQKNPTESLLTNVRLPLGIATISVSFFMFYVSCFCVDNFLRVNLLIFAAGLIVLGLGEVLIMPFVLSQITRLVPSQNQGFMAGVLMTSLGISNWCGAYISRLFVIPSSVSHEKLIVASLKTYQEGFMTIGVTSIGIASLFAICSWAHTKRSSGLNNNLDLSNK